MKRLLISLLIATSANGHAVETKYFMCETKTLRELELPFKGRYNFNDGQKKFVAVMEEDILNIFDLNSLAKIESYDVSDFFVDNVVFSPDNRFILVNPKRVGLKPMLIDRSTGEIKKELPHELMWLKNNQLGMIEYVDGIPQFSTIDPLTNKLTEISTPGLSQGFWYGFNSPDSNLASYGDYPSAFIKVYSLKEKKIIYEYQLPGIIKDFNIEKGYAVTQRDTDFSVMRLSDQKKIFNVNTKNAFSIN